MIWVPATVPSKSILTRLTMSRSFWFWLSVGQSAFRSVRRSMAKRHRMVGMEGQTYALKMGEN